jgi:hypothetical protein
MESVILVPTSELWLKGFMSNKKKRKNDDVGFGKF